MEVDMHSPSFRTLRTDNSLKRSRSPDTPTPADRPSKRISLYVNSDGAAPPAFPHDSPHAAPCVEGSSTAREEHWVARTRSLTIEGACAPPATDSMDTDMHMSLDSDAPPPRPPARPPVPAIHISTSPPQPPPPPPRAPAPYLAAPPPALPTPPLASAALQHFPALQPPRIHIQPTSPASPHEQGQGQWGAGSGAPQRRPRFTMGPRADCEKCRLGVKGHWMHQRIGEE